MSMSYEEIVNRNLDLIGRFVGAVIDDFSLADGIPSKATLVLLPDDDPELAGVQPGHGGPPDRGGQPRPRGPRRRRAVADSRWIFVRPPGFVCRMLHHTRKRWPRQTSFQSAYQHRPARTIALPCVRDSDGRGTRESGDEQVRPNEGQCVFWRRRNVGAVECRRFRFASRLIHSRTSGCGCISSRSRGR